MSKLFVISGPLTAPPAATPLCVYCELVGFLCRCVCVCASLSNTFFSNSFRIYQGLGVFLSHTQWRRQRGGGALSRLSSSVAFLFFSSHIFSISFYAFSLSALTIRRVQRLFTLRLCVSVSLSVSVSICDMRFKNCIINYSKPIGL